MNHMKRSLILIALTFAMFGVSAFAQSAYMQLKVDVPFDFYVGKQTFSAGEYSVVRTSPGILILRDSRNHVVATMLTSTTEFPSPRNSSILKFRNEGGRYLLSEVWEEGATSGFELRHSKPLPTI